MDDARREPAPLGPREVHALEHLGPVLGVRAAGTRVDVQRGAQRVVFSGEESSRLPRVERVVQLVARVLHLRHERGVLSDGWVGDHLQGSLGVAEVRFESSGGLELVLGVREVGHDRLGGGGVVPQSAVRGARVEIGDGGVEAGDVDDVQSARDGGGEGVDAAAKNADRRVG